MAKLPKEVIEAWEGRETAVVFATTASDGTPNAIYATCVSLYAEDTIVVADNYFNKTLENIRGGSTGSVLFLTADRSSYQIKGAIEYHTEGPIFDDMKSWNPTKHPGRAAAAVKVETVYKGETRLV